MYIIFKTYFHVFSSTVKISKNNPTKERGIETWKIGERRAIARGRDYPKNKKIKKEGTGLVHSKVVSDFDTTPTPLNPEPHLSCSPSPHPFLTCHWRCKLQY